MARFDEIAPADRRSVDTQVSGRLSEIQGLRAIAVLLVVVYHAGLPLAGGFVGVDVFFVISGFVITRLLLAEARSTGRIRFAHFYRRRIRRLLPAASLVVTVTLIGSLVLQSPIGAQPSTALSAIGASTWTANGVLFVLTRGYFAVNLHAFPLLHTWSLAVEEQFYLLFPAILAIGLLVARRRRAKGGWQPAAAVAAVLVGLGAIVSFGISWWLSFGAEGVVASEGLAYFSPVTRAWEFAVGALLCLCPGIGRTFRKYASQLVASLGLAMMIVSAFLIDASDPFPGVVGLGPVLGTGLVIASIGQPSNAVSALLRHRYLQRIGDWSYSWYLWHWPLIVFVQVYWPAATLAMVMAALAALPLAALTFRFVEQPIRRRSPQRPFATARLAAVCIAVPVMLSMVVLIGARNHWGSADIAEFARQVEPKPLKSDICLSDVPLTRRDMLDCTFGSSAAGRPIILVGDSNAAQYADGLVRAGRELGRPVIVATVQGCPLLDVRAELAGMNLERCSDEYRDSMRWLQQQRDALIVVGAAGVWVDMDGVNFLDPEQDAVVEDAEAKGAVWRASLGRTFETLQASGHSVVRLTAVPYFVNSIDRVWEPATCDFVRTMRDPASCGESKSRRHADSEQRFGLAADRAAASASGVAEIDLRGEICRDDVCATNDGNLWRYRDGVHLSVAESLRLAPVLKTGILASGG